MPCKYWEPNLQPRGQIMHARCRAGQDRAFHGRAGHGRGRAGRSRSTLKMPDKASGMTTKGSNNLCNSRSYDAQLHACHSKAIQPIVHPSKAAGRPLLQAAAYIEWSYYKWGRYTQREGGGVQSKHSKLIIHSLSTASQCILLSAFLQHAFLCHVFAQMQSHRVVVVITHQLLLEWHAEASSRIAADLIAGQ